MTPRQILRTLIIFAILCCNIGCDQISKSIVRKTIDYHQQIDVIENFVTLMKVENTGAFLSLGHDLPEPVRILLLTVLPLLVLVAALIFVLRKSELSDLTILGICFVIGGGIGNIYDRIVHGSVTDFLHIDFGIFQTGIFNMADVSIMTGMFIVLIASYLKSQSIYLNSTKNDVE